jgi:hypothetical protein
MDGKMSTGVRRIITGATRNNSNASTTKVYGRESATLTIHIAVLITHGGQILTKGVS